MESKVLEAARHEMERGLRTSYAVMVEGGRGA